MKRTATDAPYLSWMLIVRNCEQSLPGGLEACLKSLRARTPQAEIVIVDTCSSDATPEIAQRYADVFEVYRGPNGDWDEKMDAFDDAAAARNRALALVSPSSVWAGWADADDVVLGGDAAEKLLRQNGRWMPPMPGGKLVDGAPVPSIPSTIEDVLRFAEKLDPEADQIECPYLYHRDTNGNAISWQERERFVKLSRGWTWAESAHEVLVPKNGGLAQSRKLPHILFVHEKKWTGEDVDYSIRRHFKIMLDRYTKGDRSNRVLRYLCIYAPAKAPERWAEFVAEMLKEATSPLELYRAHIMAGDYESQRGLYNEALCHYGAATTLRAGLPDAWYAGAQAAERVEDWGTAAHWFNKAMESMPDFADSNMSPREWSLVVPSKAGNALEHLAAAQVVAGQYVSAEHHYKMAYEVFKRVYDNPIIGSDRDEAMVLMYEAKNLWEAQKAANAQVFLFDYLRRNDETLKALAVLKATSHLLEDDPRIVELEKKVRPLVAHVTDPKAYSFFYDHLPECDAIPSDNDHSSWLDPKSCLPRTTMLINWLKLHPDHRKVVELGSYDGLNAIPALRAIPDLSFTVVEAGTAPLTRIREYALKYVKDGDARLTRINGTNLKGVYLYSQDVAVLFEVIEHVPDPVQVIRDLLQAVKLGTGRVFVSTPWGAFDRGSPDESRHPRDLRGHVRAMTVQDFVDVVHEAGGEVETCFNQHVANGYGNTMQAIIKHSVESSSAVPRRMIQPVNYFVPSALWDWNASHVEKTGMGASETTIVRMAKELAKSRRVNVFGPVLEEEVNADVAYLARPKVRHSNPDATLIVSRGPSVVAALERDFGFKAKRNILWLQDACYVDLNADTAALYDKVVVLTDWHRQAMHAQGVPMEKMVIINNFLIKELFTTNIPDAIKPKRRPHHFVYSSSPDRGLIPLLKMWPMILDKWPDATLDVFYGWEGAIKLSYINPAWSKIYKPLRDDFDKLSHQKGICIRGRVNHQELAIEMMSAAAWTYPVLAFVEAGCCHADTMISVPGDHGSGELPVRKRIVDLVGQSGFPLYVFDEKERRFRIGTAKWVKQTRVVQELVELTLDDGSKLRLTDDHPVFNFDEKWVKAGELKPGDRLTALHHRYNVMIKDNNGTWQNESRLVGEWMEGRKLDGHNEHVDHADPLRLDNRPEALQVLSAADHFRKTSRGRKVRERQVTALVEGAKQWAKRNPEQVSAMRRKAQAAGQAYMLSLSLEERAARAKLSSEAQKKRAAADPEYAAWRLKVRQETGRKVSAALKAHEEADPVFAARLHAQRAASAVQARAAKQNHRVVNVERIRGPFPVYNIEVEEKNCHNYVADGVVIHNCAAFEPMAAGAVPVTIPYAGLAETGQSPWTQWVDRPDDGQYTEEFGRRFVDAIEVAVEMPEGERTKMSEFAIEKFDISVAAKQWRALIGD